MGRGFFALWASMGGMGSLWSPLYTASGMKRRAAPPAKQFAARCPGYASMVLRGIETAPPHRHLPQPEISKRFSPTPGLAGWSRQRRGPWNRQQRPPHDARGFQTRSARTKRRKPKRRREPREHVGCPCPLWRRPPCAHGGSRPIPRPPLGMTGKPAEACKAV